MAEVEMVPIYIMGKKYMVPNALTIMGALEYAGYKLIRGVGCRAAFCGACATVYRIEHDPKLHIGLACGTVVEAGMHLTQIPFYPAERAEYRLDELEPTFPPWSGSIPRCSSASVVAPAPRAAPRTCR